ncbi:ead/Ea22-like family protein [Citrobacter freundii]|uniref:ead/Ea22-like family protein n=1 Tax=Citrobacter freundii TaxID=546 RepID=UPI000EF266F0|nr:ead/Ea22-like family protein [Citrobacter freundii]AYL76012.1 hypothetical protein CUC52_11335 [Citrobacter freundii]
MTALNKQALREAAVRAGGGKWIYIRTLSLSSAYITEETGATVINCIAGDVPAKCAGFLELANPATVLALLDENLQLQRDKDSLEAAALAMRDDMREAHEKLEAAEKRIAELEARTVTLPPLNDDLIAILGRPNFTCSHLAELMRKSGDEIRRKSEHEQAAVIHWFLGIYLEHGDKWEGIAKADIQSRVAAAGIGVKGD